MTESTKTLDKTTPYPGPERVAEILDSIQSQLEPRNAGRETKRRRTRRIGWGAGGFTALAAVALLTTGALHPLVSMFDPNGNGRAYLEVDCYSSAVVGAAPTTFSNSGNNAAMRAERADAAAVCTQMAQHAALQRDLLSIQQRPDVQTAGSAVVYATDGSVWQLQRTPDGTSTGGTGWTITGGPDPAQTIGTSHAAAKPYTPVGVTAGTIVIKNFALNLPTLGKQAACTKDDVTFDVYRLTDNQTSTSVCDAHGMVAQN